MGCLWGVALSMAPAVGSIIMGTPLNFDTPGLKESTHIAETEAAQAAEVEASRVADLTVGLNCWDPSTGRVGAQIVVRDSETYVVSVIPFTAEAYERAVAGEFTTIKACA